MVRNILRKHILIILIILLGALLRFINLSRMAPFEFDQEYAANFAYSVLKVFPVQLIGQPLSVEGLFMGPLYFYYLVPFYYLTNLHPIGGTIGSVVFGLFIIMAYFWVGQKLFNKNTGLILAFLRALLFSKLQADWGAVPIIAAELVILITWYSFYSYWKKDTKWLPILGLMFGLYTSIHPILFPFYIVFILLFLIKRFLPNLKIFILSLTCFSIPLVPLIIFEILHNFLEVKKIFSLTEGTGGEPRDLARLIYHLQVNFRQPNLEYGLSLKPEWLLFAAVAAVSLILIIARLGFWKEKFHQVMLPLTFLSFILYYTLFPTHVPEYYFLGISVLFFLYSGGLLGLLLQKTFFKPILALILIYLTIQNLNLLNIGWNNPSPSTLYHKDQIVKKIISDKPENSEFYISYIRTLGWNFGFNYLFKLYGQIPQTREAVKPIYTIVIPKYLSPDNLDYISGNIGIIIEK